MRPRKSKFQMNHDMHERNNSRWLAQKKKHELAASEFLRNIQSGQHSMQDNSPVKDESPIFVKESQSQTSTDAVVD